MSKTEVRERMARLLREQAASGLSKQAFCAREGINPARFYYWQRRLREEAAEQTSEAGFHAITLNRPATVEVRLPGGTRLRLNGDDVEQLAALIRAIDEAYA